MPPPVPSCRSIPPEEEDTSLPPEEEEALRGVAQALASAYRQISARRVSALLQEAQSFVPADDSRASRRYTISPLEAACMSDISTPGAKITYRLGRDIELEYGEYHTGEYSAGNYNINKEFAEQLITARHHCQWCNRRIKYKVVGHGAAQIFTGYCRNRGCAYNKVYEKDTEMIGQYYSKLNLSHVLETVMMDSSYAGYQSTCHAQGTESISKTSYYRHCNFYIN